MSNLTKITSKNDLQTVLTQNNNALNRLDADKQDEFQKNFIELWNNKYLISQAIPSELLDFCIQVTNIGLSVNPWHKQVYILPFGIYEGKAPNKKRVGTRLEAVFTKFGIQELSFQSGFQIEVDTIWNYEGNDILSKDLNIGQRAKLNITDTKNVGDNFLGFYFELIDLNNKLHKQNCVVGMDYLKEVTKKLESVTHQIANYEHKAFRKAMSSFFIPKSRGSLEILSKIDNLNYSDEIIDTTITDTKSKPEDIKKVLSPKNEDITVEDIEGLYRSADAERKEDILKILGQDWRESDKDMLLEYHTKIMEILNA